MKLKEITFHFENCDWVTIDGKYVGAFWADNIVKRVQRTACNSIDVMEIIETFAIEIFSDANVKRCQFGVTEIEQNTFERFIRYDDITSIEFILIDEYSEHKTEKQFAYYVKWNGDDFINNAQKSYLSKLGNLYIVISDNESVFDLFDREYINDENYVQTIRNLYDIGK